MDLYIHHAGWRGVQKRFERTVYSKIDLSQVNENLPQDNPLKDDFLEALLTAFPGGLFNCWGVRESSEAVLRELQTGDVVFLVEDSTPQGRIPVLCQVGVYWHYPLLELSEALYDRRYYPYIFFFETQRIDLTWVEFLEHIQHQESYTPASQFMRIQPERFEEYQGVQGYLDYLKPRIAWSSYDPLFQPINQTDLITETSMDEAINFIEVNREIADLQELTQAEPELKGKKARQLRKSLSRPREHGFSIIVKRLYNYACAICGSELYTPEGKPEVQAAHIYPKSLDGSDDPRNGICLCRLHHWAFDAGWFSIADDYTILARDGLPEQARYDMIREFVGEKMRLPQDEAFSPHPMYLQEHRKLMGFDESD